ncbi:hypothetical protein R1sor_010626 [Riccia sorocarpa]|uniref:ATP-dependent RNA helicase n=1 Tax=Riccia sorocarpa TaxID=122646 RepID=A0ABD3I266_9MARC
MAKGHKKSTKTGVKRKATKFPWEDDTGWRNVTPGTDSVSLLFGNEEGGFMSLEEFDGDAFGTIEADAGKSVEERSNGNSDASVMADKVEKKSKKRKKAEITGGQEAADLADTSAVDGAISADPQKETAKNQNPKKKRKLKEKRQLAASAAADTSSDVAERCEVEGASTLNEVSAEEKTAEPVEKRKKRKPRVGSKARRARKRDQEMADQATEVSASVSGGVKDSGDLEEFVCAEAGPLETEEGDDEPSPSVSAEELPDEEFDISAWADMRLHPLLQKAIRGLKFKEPTPIQRECIPAAAHKGKDVIGAAETGSGKTLAFGLPILQRLLEEKEKFTHSLNLTLEEAEAEAKSKSQGPLRALIVSPTRELALQICDHLKAAAKWTSINIVPIVGGMATPKQERLLSYKPEIVVGTPGRLWELMSNGQTHLLELHSLSFFILDEADRMVEKGHFKELQSIIDSLPQNHKKSAEEEENSNFEGLNSDVGVEVELPKMRKRRQTLVFSATLALPPNFKNKLKMSNQKPKPFMKSLDSVAALSERAGVSYKAAIVDLTSSNIVAKNLTECALECRDEEKDLHLYYLLKVHGGGRSIVFCTSIAAVRRVSALLKILQLTFYPLHAQMQQKQRLKAMDRFRSSGDGILVATDVAARGLDVPGIRTVVHYQLPHSAEIYVHRSGRTARASTDGCSIALVSPADRTKYLTLCKALSRPEGFNSFPINMAYMPACKARVDLAIKVDKLVRKNAQSQASHAWLARSAKAMELDIEDVEDDQMSSEKGSTLSKSESAQVKAAQKELESMLSQPVKPKAFSNRYITGSGLTPLVTKQLQEYALSASKKGSGGKAAAGKQPGKNRLVVIGQQQMDPLEVLRLSNSQPTAKRPFKRRRQ